MSQRFRRHRFVLSSVVLLLIVLAVVPVSAQESTVTVRTTDNLNLRASASTRARVLNVIPYDTQLTATAISADGVWLAVAYEGQFGWIASDYVTVEEGYLVELPVAGDTAVPPALPARNDGFTPPGLFDHLVDRWEHAWGLAADEETVSTQSEMIITEPTSGLELPGNQVHVAWLAVTNAASYRVDVYSDQAEITYTATYRTTGTSVDVPTSEMPARANGWGYWIEVAALDENGNVIAQDRIWGRRVEQQAEAAPAASAPSGRSGGGWHP